METRAISVKKGPYVTLHSTDKVLFAINHNAKAPLKEKIAKFHSLREILRV